MLLSSPAAVTQNARLRVFDASRLMTEDVAL